MTMPSSQGRRGPSFAKSFSVLTNTNQCPTAMETAVSLNRQKRRFQPVCCVKATPVLQSRCCRERRCRGFSIRPETKEGPFVLKCADRLEGEGGNGRTNRCGPHRRFVSMAKRRGSRRRIRCVTRGARFGERFEGRRSEPGGLQLSNGDESPEGLRQKEGHESVGGVEERWRIVRGLRTMAQSHGAVLSEDVLRGRREPRPDCLLSTIKGKKK